MASLDLLILQNLEISQTGIWSHGISRFAALVEQHIAKNWLIHA